MGQRNVLGILVFTELCVLSRKGNWILQTLNWPDRQTDRQTDMLRSIGATVLKGIECYPYPAYRVLCFAATCLIPSYRIFS